MARRVAISVRKYTPVRKVRRKGVRNTLNFIQEQYEKGICGIHLQTFYNIKNQQDTENIMLSQSLGRWMMAKRRTYDSLHLVKKIGTMWFFEMFIYNPFVDSRERVNSGGRAVRNVIIDESECECFTVTRSIVRIIGIRNKELDICDVFMIGEKNEIETEKEVWEMYDENFFN